MLLDNASQPCKHHMNNFEELTSKRLVYSSECSRDMKFGENLFIPFRYRISAESCEIHPEIT